MADLLISDNEGVRFLTLNRPEKRNALNDDLIASLKRALDDCSSEPSFRSIVIRGAGKDFCSGADLASIQKIADATYEENLDDARKLMELFMAIRQLALPVIAAVHGRALAGGAGLATACDIVLASKSARFGYPEVKIGFVPAMVMTILRRNLGEKAAFEMATQGNEFSAEEARQLGLVNQTFDDEIFENEVENYANRYAKISRSAVAMTKHLLYDIDGKDFELSMSAGAEVNAKARMSQDCKDGIARFLQKQTKPE